MLLRLTCLLLLSLCLPLAALAADGPLRSPAGPVCRRPALRRTTGRTCRAGRAHRDRPAPARRGQGFDETRVAESLGLRYVRIPVAGAEGLDAANVRAVHQALRQSQGPVLLHCASGNRAGAVLGLVNARYEHASPEQALQLGQRAGLTSLEAATRQRLATPVTSP